MRAKRRINQILRNTVKNRDGAHAVTVLEELGLALHWLERDPQFTTYVDDEMGSVDAVVIANFNNGKLFRTAGGIKWRIRPEWCETTIANILSDFWMGTVDASVKQYREFYPEIEKFVSMIFSVDDYQKLAEEYNEILEERFSENFSWTGSKGRVWINVARASYKNVENYARAWHQAFQKRKATPAEFNEYTFFIKAFNRHLEENHIDYPGIISNFFPSLALEKTSEIFGSGF